MNTLHQTTLHKYLILLTLTLLSACSITPDKSVDDMISDAVRQTGEEGFDATTKTAEYYIKLASESSGETQQKYLIKAAELLYQRGDLASAQDQLKNIKAGEIDKSRQIQIQLLAAKVALANHNPAQAVELLPKQSRMTVKQFIEISEVRAEANMAMGYLLEVIKTRIHIDSYYKDEKQRENNHTAIWSAFNALPSVVLDKLKTKNKVLQGWLKLARIVRTAQTNNRKLQQHLLSWASQFPKHPANKALISQILEDHLNVPTKDHSIAVLLPLNGAYKAVSDAIKSGFLSAYYADTKKQHKPGIRFYDTSAKDLDFVALYEKVLDDGADYIVGPLDKSMINQLIKIDDFDIPVLTLNYAEDALSTADNLYQFGLLPEDEARQVAELAIRQNKTRAAVLVPNGLWGHRLKTAFQQRYTELGGTVLSSVFFNDKVDDYGQPIKQLLNLQLSNNRHKDVQHLLGSELKYSPYRRQDIDMIFLAGTSRSARSIMPAFKFHHAADVPVYSTSHVYTGNKNRAGDLDLNGLTFCDIPWVLMGDNKLNKTFNKNWPEQKNYTRLFALGADRYHILYNLNLLSKYEYARFAGQTGNISMDKNKRLHRELLWGTFRKGSAYYIDTTIAPKPTAQIEPNKS